MYIYIYIVLSLVRKTDLLLEVMASSFRTLNPYKPTPSVDTKNSRSCAGDLDARIKNLARHVFGQAEIAQQHFVILDIFVVSLVLNDCDLHGLQRE